MRQYFNKVWQKNFYGPGLPTVGIKLHGATQFPIGDFFSKRKQNTFSTLKDKIRLIFMSIFACIQNVHSIKNFFTSNPETSNTYKLVTGGEKYFLN